MQILRLLDSIEAMGSGHLFKKFDFVGPNDKTFVIERSKFRRKRDSSQRTPLSLKQQCHNQAVEKHVKTVFDADSQVA